MTREEAIERIKARFDYWALDTEDMEAIQAIVPELAKSEDERIIDAIGIALTGDTAEKALKSRGVTLPDALAYLEKQKEQRPVEWSEKDEMMRLNTLRILEGASRVPTSDGGVQFRFSEIIRWLKSLRDKFEEEDNL